MNVMTDTSADQLLIRLKAIADEKRLRILTLLAGGERCVCDLQEALETGQSLLSFHLKTLKDAGLVADRRQGRWIYYRLDRERLGALEQFLQDVRTAEAPPEFPARCCD